jgi:hypothetical protein
MGAGAHQSRPLRLDRDDLRRRQRLVALTSDASGVSGGDSGRGFVVDQLKACADGIPPCSAYLPIDREVLDLRGMSR